MDFCTMLFLCILLMSCDTHKQHTPISTSKNPSVVASAYEKSKLFELARQSLGQSGSLTATELLQIEKNLKTVTPDMRQYPEAQVLLSVVQKTWLETVRQRLEKSDKLTATDFLEIEESLKAVTQDMSQYFEVQALLDLVKKKEKSFFAALEVENRRKEAVRLKGIEDDAKQRQKEAALFLSKAGRRVFARHPDWTYEDCDLIGKGQIQIGMTREQIREAWGKPYVIIRTHTSHGTQEQWVMSEMGRNYVYFENGICTAIQN